MDRLLPSDHGAGDVTAVSDDTALAAVYDFPADLHRPWVKVNFICSVDGAVTLGGKSGGLSNPDDKRIFRLGRTLADVILVGSATALIERYQGVKPGELDTDLRAERGLAPIPPIAVVTRSASLPPESPLVRTSTVPTIVFTADSAPAERRKALTDAGAEVVIVGDDDVDEATMLAELDRRALHRVCCEGGPHLFGSLIAADLVDELDLTVAPLLVGGDAGRIATGTLPAGPTSLRLVSVLHANDQLMLRYLRQGG